ncbi:MAG TPA: PadR family transcriptional regulator [Solirubrobacteraceae bacterium]
MADPEQVEREERELSQETPTPLTPTGRVILGMVALGKRTGYDIKQLVDRSVRFFWAASYGQIYPELRRLEEQGLISGRPEPSGGRARTVYELTDAGRHALQDWLAGEIGVHWELRDEGMLKLFFSDFTDPEQRLQNVRAMREGNERKLAQLQTLQSGGGPVHAGPAMTLELGLGMTQWLIDWCRNAEARLEAAAKEDA